MEKEGYSLVPSREKLFAMTRSLFEDRANDMQERMREIVGDSGDECIPVKITKKIAFFLLEFRDLPVDDRKRWKKSSKLRFFRKFTTKQS